MLETLKIREQQAGKLSSASLEALTFLLDETMEPRAKQYLGILKTEEARREKSSSSEISRPSTGGSLSEGADFDSLQKKALENLLVGKKQQSEEGKTIVEGDSSTNKEKTEKQKSADLKDLVQDTRLLKWLAVTVGAYKNMEKITRKGLVVAPFARSAMKEKFEAILALEKTSFASKSYLNQVRTFQNFVTKIKGKRMKTSQMKELQKQTFKEIRRLDDNIRRMRKSKNLDASLRVEVFVPSGFSNAPALSTLPKNFSSTPVEISDNDFTTPMVDMTKIKRSEILEDELAIVLAWSQVVGSRTPFILVDQNQRSVRKALKIVGLGEAIYDGLLQGPMKREEQKGRPVVKHAA